jgi:transglutaminase-like putative cysteine protease
MLIRVSHLATYRYDKPASSVIQILRQTPRNHDGQFVLNWRIDVSADCRLDEHEDAFGNITHAFTINGALETLKVLVEGEVETRDTQGIVRGAVERFPPSLFLRETTLTQPGEEIHGFAAQVQAETGDDALKALHLTLARLHDELEYDPVPAASPKTAAEAFAAKRGGCRDLAHIFIAAARSLNIPARFIGGYCCGDDGTDGSQAGHAWAEAFVPGLGWVAFDAANGICATEAHVRVAVGLDCLGAAPVRGTHYGGGEETLTVELQVDQAGRQVQS